MQENARSGDVVVLDRIDRSGGNNRYLPAQLRFQRKRIAQRVTYLVLPGFAPLLRRARPVGAPAPLRGAGGLVAAHGRAGDQASGSSPPAAVLVGHQQRHRLGGRVSARRTVSGKSLLALVNI